MKPINKPLTLTLCLFLFHTAIPVAHSFEDAIIAIVHDETITFRDLRDYIKSTYSALAAQGYPQQQLQAIKADLESNGLSKLIEDKLMLSKAKEIELEVRSKAIDDKMAEIKSRYGSDEEFMQAMIENGVSLTDLRNKITEQLKIKYVIDYEVKSKIYVNPQEVTDYYEKHMDSFYKKEQVNLDSIFIRFSDDPQAAQVRAQQALDALKRGETFEQVASRFSDAPSIGTVTRGQLLPAIEKTVFHLKKEEISPILAVENGLYIFRLNGRKEAELANLDDVKDLISELLFKQKFQDAFIAWLDKLKHEYYVEIKQ